MASHKAANDSPKCYMSNETREILLTMYALLFCKVQITAIKAIMENFSLELYRYRIQTFIQHFLM